MYESIVNNIIEWVFLGVMVFFYFFPVFIAYNRKHQNVAPITVINLFFGWTLIGWVVSMAWACSKVE
jgi:Superinfection immunity protein